MYTVLWIKNKIASGCGLIRRWLWLAQPAAFDRTYYWSHIMYPIKNQQILYIWFCYGNIQIHKYLDKSNIKEVNQNAFQIRNIQIFNDVQNG